MYARTGAQQTRYHWSVPQKKKKMGQKEQFVVTGNYSFLFSPNVLQTYENRFPYPSIVSLKYRLIAIFRISKIRPCSNHLTLHCFPNRTHNLV